MQKRGLLIGGLLVIVALGVIVFFSRPEQSSPAPTWTPPVSNPPSAEVQVLPASNPPSSSTFRGPVGAPYIEGPKEQPPTGAPAR
ncbi:MAG: hypothetical protein FJY98_01395 [Candidatus Liptonbacteria bacterium]|nr:hypothetical protein [Candidatus Liptonbacteria bacterium]